MGGCSSKPALGTPNKPPRQPVIPRQHQTADVSATSVADAENLTCRLLDILLAAAAAAVSLPVRSHAERVPSGDRGFSVGFVRGVCAFFARHGAEWLEMGDVCKKEGLDVSICRLTGSTGLSLVESCLLVAEREGIDASALFGRTSTFFSYSWTGSALCDVVAACERAITRLNAEDAATRFLWLDMLCASQNLLAGTYQDLTKFPAGTPGHAARKEDTDALFDGALDASAEIVFYLSPLVEEWDAPLNPYLRADRGEPPVHWRRKGPRATTRAWCLFELTSKLAKGGRLLVELCPEVCADRRHQKCPPRMPTTLRPYVLTRARAVCSCAGSRSAAVEAHDRGGRDGVHPDGDRHQRRAGEQGEGPRLHLQPHRGGRRL